MIEKNINLTYSELQLGLSEASVKELNIYNQAYIILERPVLKSRTFHMPTKHEIPLIFKVSGDLSGYISCCMDLEEEKENTPNINFIQSLYIESMNIVLGKLLTNLDFQSDMLCTLQEPEIFPTDAKLNLLRDYASKNDIYGWSYKLICQSREFDCRINFFHNPRRK